MYIHTDKTLNAYNAKICIYNYYYNMIITAQKWFMSKNQQ